MNKKLASLTWKFFLEQKISELFISFVFLVVIIVPPSLVGESLGYKGVEAWMLGAWILTLGGLVLVGILSTLWIWIKTNWIKAKRRAKAELKRRIK